MKKKLLSLLLITAMTMLLIACGGGKKEETTTPKDEEWNEIVEDIAEEEDLEKNSVNTSSFLFAKSSKWDEVKNPLHCVQIENLFFESGITVGKLVEMLDESDEEYYWGEYYNVDLDSMQSSGKLWYPMLYVFDGYLEVFILNPYEKEVPLKECICLYYGVNFMNEYSHRIGGYNADEISEWTEDDCKKLLENDELFVAYEHVQEEDAPNAIILSNNDAQIEFDSGTIKGKSKIYFTKDTDGTISHANAVFKIED